MKVTINLLLIPGMNLSVFAQQCSITQQVTAVMCLSPFAGDFFTTVDGNSYLAVITKTINAIHDHDTVTGKAGKAFNANGETLIGIYDLS
ncbi:MAG: hypothetical protein MI921_18045 [Cytophagales bacterium]|nr:hypothetical protein [Cytophagales bacterium]